MPESYPGRCVIQFALIRNDDRRFVAFENCIFFFPSHNFGLREIAFAFCVGTTPDPDHGVCE
jgi:hypothetical protein